MEGSAVQGESEDENDKRHKVALDKLEKASEDTILGQACNKYENLNKLYLGFVFSWISEGWGVPRCIQDSKRLLEKYGPDRVVDNPITEARFVGIGVGASYYGLRPVVEFMTFNFSMQAVDHIINSAAKSNYMSTGQVNVPIVFRGPNGAAVGVGAQHSQCFAAWYGTYPGLKVLAPYSFEDACGLLKAAIRDPDSVVFLENELLLREKERMSRLQLFQGWWAMPLRQLRFLRRKGSVLRPLDRAIINASVQKTSRLVTVEEGFPQHGVGVEICGKAFIAKGMQGLELVGKETMDLLIIEIGIEVDKKGAPAQDDED
ncbi:unnamed protein product [Camellia sinensis]